MNEDFARLGELIAASPGRRSATAARRVAEVWAEALGPDVASNSRPRSLRNGRLVVATSSSVWAQTLQLLSADVVSRLNAALGEEVLREAVFRPAGWDPGGGAGGPRPLAGQALGEDADQGDAGPRDRPRRTPLELTPDEEAAVERVVAAAEDEEVGRLVGAAMRASLRRPPRDA